MGTRASTNSTPLPQGLAVTIRVLLAHRGLSRRDLTRMAGRSDAYWHKRMTGAAGFNLADVESLAEAFQVRPEELMTRAAQEAARFREGRPVDDWWAIPAQ